MIKTMMPKLFENASPKALLTMLRDFEPKVPMTIDAGDFEIRTARNHEEVEEALRLRYRIFFAELQLMSIGENIDIDLYDLLADHLLLIDKLSGNIVGTYRMLCSRFTDRFYSQTEFDLRNILALEGTKLELGRACVDTAFRGSIAVQLLWKGMTTYFTACGARYMFGCSSIDGHLESSYAAIHQYLNKDHMVEAGQMVFPHQDIPSWIKLDAEIDDNGMRRAERLVPALLKAYLRAGSKVCGMPFWDPVFNTLDYFTFFDAQDITDAYSRKFGIAQA